MDDNQLVHHSKKWDRTGVLVSALCLAHCLAFPVLVILLPTTRQFLSHPLLEALLLISAISVGSISFVTSYKTHRQQGPLALGTVGIIIMSIGLYYGSSHSQFDHTQDLDHFNIPMVLGGLFLICGHIWNKHACHCFCDSKCSHQEHQN